MTTYSEDLTKGKSVTSSNQPVWHSLPPKAIDDNPDTYWYAGGVWYSCVGDWIRIDLVTQHAVCKITIQNSAHNNNGIRNFTFEGSNSSGGPWSIVYTGIVTPLDHNVHTYEFSNTDSFRFYRLVCVDSYAYDHFAISEIELMELITYYTLSGTVYNNDNTPIKNATVTINDTELLTNQDGYYEATVESGTYDLTASKECYSEDSASVTVTDTDIVQDFIIDCTECEICPTCPPDKLDWWLLIVGGIVGHLLKRSKKNDKR